jgi:hypothetical protein
MDRSASLHCDYQGDNVTFAPTPKQKRRLTMYNPDRISGLEKACVYLLALLLFALLFGYYKTIKPYTQGDTAFLIEAITKLADNANATSSMLAQNSAEIKLGRIELEIYCQQGLAAEQFTTDPYGVFSLHAYTFLYLIAPIAKVLGALNTISAFTAMAFTFIPCIAYLYLRKSGLSSAISILVAAISIIHPAWLISSDGQFYVDRLFIPFSLLYTILLHQYLTFDKNSDIRSSFLLLPIFLIGLLGGGTSERNMLVIGIFSLVYALTARTVKQRKFFIVGFSGVCIIYVIIYLHFWEGTPDIARAQQRLFRLTALIKAITKTGIGEYLLFNLSLLILPALIVPRLCMSVIPIVALNSFITVGGAEKNGWLTHYHSHYYGFIIAAFLVSIVTANDKFKNGLSFNFHKLIFPGILIVVILFTGSIQHLYKGMGIYLSLWDYYARPKTKSSLRYQKYMFDTLSNNVPVGETVTATEWGMAAWYLRGNAVNIFPIGVGINNYIMVQAKGSVPNIKLLSAVRFKADVNLANECFVPIISEYYKEVAREGTWVLFKKKSHELPRNS